MNPGQGAGNPAEQGIVKRPAVRIAIFFQEEDDLIFCNFHLQNLRQIVGGGRFFPVEQGFTGISVKEGILQPAALYMLQNGFSVNFPDIRSALAHFDFRNPVSAEIILYVHEYHPPLQRFDTPLYYFSRMMFMISLVMFSRFFDPSTT